MFNIFKKKRTGNEIFAVADGEIIPITEVKDDVFSTKMLGDGYGIHPSNDEIYAPIDGKITTLFPTKHAIGITTENGLEVLIHLGLDTVELKGKPFDVFIEEGASVKVGQKIVAMNRKSIVDEGYDDTIIVVYTNMDKIDSISEIKKNHVNHADKVQILTLK